MGDRPPVSPGDVVLACGTPALKVLQEAGLAHKNRVIHSLREQPIKYKNAHILISYDARITEKEYHYLSDIQWDVQLAARLHTTGTVLPPLGHYTLVESLHDVIEQIEEKFAATQKPVEVACDLETKGLDPYNLDAWIIACSFTVEQGQSTVLYFTKGERPICSVVVHSQMEVYWKQLWEQIHWILNSPHVSIRGANFKYDAAWMMKKWQMPCTNFKFDTVLVGSLISENRSNSLKLHAKVYTPMGGYEKGMSKYDMGALEKVPVLELVDYVGGDTDATFRVACKLKEELKQDKQLTNFYTNLLHPASRVFEKMERIGVVLDLPYYRGLQPKLAQEITRLHHELVKVLPEPLRFKHRESIAESLTKGSSPMKPKILSEFLFTKAGLNLKPKMWTATNNEPSTSMTHLLMFKDDPRAINFIKSFQGMTKATKILSTFVIGFLAHVRADNRFHPSYMLHRGSYQDSDSGTTTGRSSARDPAVQTIPKHSKKGETDWPKMLRRAYIAPDGYAILNGDFVQGELKIAAILANEPTMLQAYHEGMDLHSITAAALNGLTMSQFMALEDGERENLRYGGKVGNFGLLYGMQPKGFMNYAFSTYEVTMTEEEASAKRDAFFNLYPRLLIWHEEYKRFAHHWGFVRSPLGRIRHLPLIHSKEWEVFAAAERMSINAPVQSCLSDMVLLAMVELDRLYGNDFQPFLMTHDALSIYCPENETEMWAKRIKEVMENLPLHKFDWNPVLKFTVDIEVGSNLAELKKLKNLQCGEPCLTAFRKERSYRLQLPAMDALWCHDRGSFDSTLCSAGTPFIFSIICIIIFVVRIV